MTTVLPNHNPKRTIFQNITFDNYFLMNRCNQLMATIHGLESNVQELNGFIRRNYDLSYNVIENIKIMVFDSSDNIISCMHTDTSGNFVTCEDLSLNNYLPCVINPSQPVVKIAKTHITDMCDVSRGYPFYPYSYDPYYYNPYYAYLYRDSENLDLKPSPPNSVKKTSDSERCFPYYPYYPYFPNYPYLLDDDYFYRDIDVKPPTKPGQPIMPRPRMMPNQGTHIHIHNPPK